MRWLTTIWVLFASFCSNALDYQEAYTLALHQNPDYLAAQEEHKAAQEYIARGRAGLLPSLSLNYSQAQNWSDVEQQSGTFANSEKRDYQSHNASLVLQQPLFDYSAWAAYQKAKQQTLESDFRLIGKNSALAMTVLEAFTKALLARDQLDLAKQQLSSYEALLVRKEALKDHGEGTQTEVLETQSRLYIAETELIEAQDEFELSLRELSSLIEQPVAMAALPRLKESQKDLPMLSNDIRRWLSLALSQNPELRALNHKVRAASHEVDAQRGGHLPRVSLYATARDTESDTENTYQQRYDTHSVGIRIQMPLYSGGKVSSATRQASATKSQFRYELDARRQEIKLQIRRYYRKCMSSLSSLKARSFAVISAEALVEATQKSVQGGERDNQDILNAERQLFQARRDLVETRYDYLKSWLGLYAVAGMLAEEHIQLVSSQFQTAKEPSALSQ
ncbi:TolC family outer membrane protein [Hahella ganghwensis]|uniref:TolC family outer membrane protein n=1 Tax=Hahella ganghwensis TaxID=286420 RepID=UPI000378F334|nr:TolC family outer membrane protein [Hahella ganghwensis]